MCPWTIQLDAVATGLEQLAPTLEHLDFRLLIKTHEEITSFEIGRLIDKVGQKRMGVALDPVNLLVRLEDPTAGVRRLQAHVSQIHLDDAQVRFDGTSVRRYLCPFGQGAIEWPAIFGLCPEAAVWIELHRGQFAVPAFDPDWLAEQPDLNLKEYAAVLAMAVQATAGLPPDQTDPSARLPSLVDASLRGAIQG